MSSDTESTAAAIVATFDSLYTSRYCGLAASVLFIFDTFITFDREVACFWAQKRIGGGSLLFFANKWISMTVYGMSVVAFATFSSDKVSIPSPSMANLTATIRGSWSVERLIQFEICIIEVCSCSVFSIAFQAFSILQFVPGAAFSALRAFVLSRSKLLGVLVLALSLAPVGANLVLYGYQYSGENFPPFGCLTAYNAPPALNLRLASNLCNGTRSSLELPHSGVHLSSTTHRCRRCTHLHHLVKAEELGLQRTQGYATVHETLAAGYTLLRWNHIFCQSIRLECPPPRPFGECNAGSDPEASLVTVFTAPITAILISRFLLELQEAHQMVVKLDANDTLHSSRNPQDSAPSFISSLGGFVNPALSGSSDDNEGFDLQVRSPPQATGEEEGGAQTEETAASLIPSA
ncbi:hypothetical protein K466DRAFT_604879 [Polyporus arcularius HHB13444]|uniref:DUF6533 domain-containing protein n=1 Tax=Polyporus arcularius HHB13444 TaxID=1314778 RepID=A0A5C3NUI5_9APHY|nr:hypothetical protein K466DRAFT_604879 [Polyporus arcularius HHB13444]